MAADRTSSPAFLFIHMDVGTRQFSAGRMFWDTLYIQINTFILQNHIGQNKTKITAE